MKNKLVNLAIMLAILAGTSSATAQGTAFTYQGQLDLNGTPPADGVYYMDFKLFANALGTGTALNDSTPLPIPVTNGLFTAILDYGSTAFTGAQRWLQIGVSTNGIVGPFTYLTPLQQFTPVPYAIYAENAAAVNASSITVTQLNTTASPGNGQILSFSGGNLVWEDPATASAAWSLTGNGGTIAGTDFVGTTDNQPLELHVNGMRALRLEPTASVPNLIGGYSGNLVDNSAQASTIGGGGTAGYVNHISSTLGTIAGGSGNIIGANANDATIGGGRQNRIDLGAWGAFIGGGHSNWIQTASSPGGNIGNSSYSAILGGYGNTILSNSYYATIGGGNGNTISNNTYNDVISGGVANTVSGYNSMIGGGVGNLVTYDYSFIGGGQYNVATGLGSTVVGGDYNSASGPVAFIGGGSGNQASGNGATIAAGSANIASGVLATVSGGLQNTASGTESTIGGGIDNSANADYSTVGGGSDNNASGLTSTVGGGQYNHANADYSTVAGGFENVLNSSNSFAVGSFNSIQSFSANSTIGGGASNLITANSYGTIGGGLGNQVSHSGVVPQAGGTVPGGEFNWAFGFCSLAAGYQARAINDGTFVWADSQNAPFTSTGNNQFLIRAGGGVGINTASPQAALAVNGSVIVDSAGLNNGTPIANGLTFGGSTGEGIGSVRTAGNADQNGLNFYTDYIKRLTILNNGNVGIGTTNATHLLVVGSGGAYCAGTTWVNGSDRNTKQNFTELKPAEVLEKVSRLPITQWQYKVDAEDTRHIGPMAQDFHQAFGLNGADDKHISTVDEGGVALAAIQGLNQKLNEKDAEIHDLKQSMDDLKKLVQSLAERK